MNANKMARHYVVTRLIGLMALGFATEVRAQDTDVPASGAAMAPLPRAERQKLLVLPLTFTAQLTDAQKAELNSLSNVIAIWKGGGAGGSVNQALVNMSRSAADILTEQLMHSGRFRIVERGSLGDSASVAPESLVARAKALGASFVVLGSISKFAEVRKSKAAGGLIGGAINKKSGGLLGGGLRTGKSFYVVGMTVRAVDTETGEVVATYTTDGELEGDKTLTVLAGLGGGNVGIAGGASSATAGERGVKISEALQISAANLVVKLIESQQRGDFIRVP